MGLSVAMSYMHSTSSLSARHESTRTGSSWSPRHIMTPWKSASKVEPLPRPAEKRISAYMWATQHALALRQGEAGLKGVTARARRRCPDPPSQVGAQRHVVAACGSSARPGSASRCDTSSRGAEPEGRSGRGTTAARRAYRSLYHPQVEHKYPLA